MEATSGSQIGKGYINGLIGKIGRCWLSQWTLVKLMDIVS